MLRFKQNLELYFAITKNFSQMSFIKDFLAKFYFMRLTFWKIVGLKLLIISQQQFQPKFSWPLRTF